MRARLRTRLLLAIGGVVAASVWLSLAIVTRDPGKPISLVLALGLGAAAGFGLVKTVVSWLDQTVKPLTQAARRMQKGDLDVRARLGHDQDVGQLGAAFDSLGENLSRTVGELRSERDLMSRILNGMHEGILLLDKEDKIALMNPALREMLLLQADVIDRPLLEVVRHAELKEILDRARASGVSSSGEVELGGLKPRRLLVSGTPFKEQGGGLLAVFFDVTDVRRLESLRRDFVANVSHELRTPVTAILSAAETLDSALAKDPESARRFLGIIDRNAQRLQRLIEDLLDLSRIESRELRLRPERFAFEPFATHLVGMFKDRADKKQVTIKLECSRGIEAHADRRALEQVVTNLVDNAVKYCPPGCTVKIVSDRTTTPEGMRFRVEDDGPGIGDAHLPRLFERFYRVDAGRSREMGGTGLGLSIVKHLVEAMDGSISVVSTVGKGTTFTVVIPYVHDSKENAA